MNKDKMDFIEEDIVVAKVFLEDINNLTEHLNKVIISHNEMLEKLEEKDKVIDEAIEYINQQIFDMTMTGNGTFSLDRLLEILERGKNEKR